MQHVRALFGCETTTVIIVPRLFNELEISHEVVQTTRLGLGRQSMQYAKDSRKTSITVQCMEHYAPVTEPEVLVILMHAYNPVLRPRQFWARYGEIEWNLYRSTAIWPPYGSQAVDIFHG